LWSVNHKNVVHGPHLMEHSTIKTRPTPHRKVFALLFFLYKEAVNLVVIFHGPEPRTVNLTHRSEAFFWWKKTTKIVKKSKKLRFGGRKVKVRTLVVVLTHQFSFCFWSIYFNIKDFEFEFSHTSKSMLILSFLKFLVVIYTFRKYYNEKVFFFGGLNPPISWFGGLNPPLWWVKPTTLVG